MSNSYDDWISMFDSEFNEIWIKEEKDLKKLSMVYCAFIKEILSVKNTVDKEIDGLRAAIKQRDFLKKCQNFKGIAESEQINLTLPLQPELDSNKENLPLKNLNNVNKKIRCKNILSFSESSSASDSELTSSPIIYKSHHGRQKSRSGLKSFNFLLNKKSTNNTNLNDSKMLECKETNCVDTSVIASTSESVSKNKSILQTMKLNGAKYLDLNDTNCVDTSIIESTPEPVLKCKNLKLSLIDNQKKKKSSKRHRNNTLTQMLGEPVVTKKNRIIDTNDASMNIDEILDIVADDDDDETIITNTNIDLTLDDSDHFYQSSFSKNSRPSLTKHTKNNYDNLNFIQLLPSKSSHDSKLINETKIGDVHMLDFPSTSKRSSASALSKSGSSKNEGEVDFIQPLSPRNSKISSGYLRNFNKFPEQMQRSPNDEPRVVRGKERKKLKGWSCKECENFYKYLNLSDGELEKKMNECSKHRSKPPDDTFSGFWNMTFRSTQK